MRVALLIICLVASIFTNAQTKFQWVKGIGGTAMDLGNDIHVDPSGNVYTIGWFGGVVDFDPGSSLFNLTSIGDYDFFISKLDSSGNFVWAKQLGGNSDNDDVPSFVLDTSGSIYITGMFQETVDFDPSSDSFNLTCLGYLDFFILKLDASGNFVWVKRIGDVDADVIGVSITLDASGNIYTCGYFYGTADFDPGSGIFTLSATPNADIFIIKLDASGDFVWVKNMKGNSNVYPSDIELDASGNIYTTGILNDSVDFDPGSAMFYLTSTSYDFVAFICKLDSSGDFVWAKEMSGTSDVYGNSIAIDSSANIYTLGIFKGSADFDPGSGTNNLTALGDWDMYILKLDPSGNFVWIKQIKGDGMEDSHTIIIDATNHIYYTGSFIGTADFNPGSGVFNLTAIDKGNIFISKLDLSGNLIWAKNIGGKGIDGGSSIVVDASGNIYTIGEFEETVDFDLGAGTSNLSSNGKLDVFILKMSQDTNTKIENFISIFPNPNNGIFNIVLSIPTDNARMEVYNSIGALVYNQIIFKEQNIIDLSNRANGLYIVKVMGDDNIIATQKIIKQ